MSVALVMALVSICVGPLPAMAVRPAPAVEVEPNDLASEATTITADASITLAEISPAWDTDFFKVDLIMGHTYRIETGPDTTQLGQGLPMQVSMIDADGSTGLSPDYWGSVPGGFMQMFYAPNRNKTIYIAAQSQDMSYSGKYGIRVTDLNAPNSSISGKVTGPGGVGLAGITVTDRYYDPWFHELDPDYGIDSRAVTNASGLYTRTTFDGIHTVTFQDPSGKYPAQAYDGKWTYSEATQFLVEAGIPRTGINAVMGSIVSRATSTARVSVDAAGVQGTDSGGNVRGSRSSAMSSDGRFVMFLTGNALVGWDHNNSQDWYVKDTAGGGVKLVSQATNGAQPGAGSDTYEADVSADGRFAVFDSDSDGFVSDDDNGVKDVFYRDLETGITTRISVDAEGKQGSRGSRSPSMSDDGRYVAFLSGAALVPDDTNGSQDIYLRDMVEGTIERVSVASDGSDPNARSWEPDISADGSRIAFESEASNLVENDTNNEDDVFVYDTNTHTTTRASVGAGAVQANNSSDEPAISGNGRYVAFASYATNLGGFTGGPSHAQQIYVRDLQAGTTSCASLTSEGVPNDDYCEEPDISADGRYVTFVSDDPGALLNLNVVPGDSNDEGDIFVRDMLHRTTAIVSVNADRGPTDEYSYEPKISADGLRVSFSSYATNIVKDDTNDCMDVFVTDLAPVVEDMRPVYRFYNLRTGVHFFTASEGEKTSVMRYLSRSFRYEGVAYSYNASNPDNGMPLYRFYNIRTGSHFYTISEGEKASLMTPSATRTWRFEGIAYRVSSTSGLPVYRFFNRRTGSHFYTANEGEKAQIQTTPRSTFVYEGAVFWLAQ